MRSVTTSLIAIETDAVTIQGGDQLSQKSPWGSPRFLREQKYKASHTSLRGSYKRCLGSRTRHAITLDCQREHTSDFPSRATFASVKVASAIYVLSLVAIRAHRDKGFVHPCDIVLYSSVFITHD